MSNAFIDAGESNAHVRPIMQANRMQNESRQWTNMFDLLLPENCALYQYCADVRCVVLLPSLMANMYLLRNQHPTTRCHDARATSEKHLHRPVFASTFCKSSTQHATAMPLGEQEGLLIGAGVSLSLATTYFYRQRQTLPFKVQLYNAAGSTAHACNQHICFCVVQVQLGAGHPASCMLPLSRVLMIACTSCSGRIFWRGPSWAPASYWPCRPATTRWQTHFVRAA